MWGNNNIHVSIQPRAYGLPEGEGHVMVIINDLETRHETEITTYYG